MPTFADDFDRARSSTPPSGSRAASRSGAPRRATRRPRTRCGTRACGCTCPRTTALWCPEDHPPLRVSDVQSGGSPGRWAARPDSNRWAPGPGVREQPAQAGWTPTSAGWRCGPDHADAAVDRGLVAGRASRTRPERCAELCMAEVFGTRSGSADDGRASAAVGMRSAHPFRDPRMVEDFAALAAGDRRGRLPHLRGRLAAGRRGLLRGRGARCARSWSRRIARCSPCSRSSTSRSGPVPGSPTSSPSSSSTSGIRLEVRRPPARRRRP